MVLPLFSSKLVHFKQKNILRPPMISLLCSLISLHTHTMQPDSGWSKIIMPKGKHRHASLSARQRIGEGNVFSRVCPSVSHSVHRGGGPSIQGPNPARCSTWTSLYSSPPPRHIQTSSLCKHRLS